VSAYAEDPPPLYIDSLVADLFPAKSRNFVEKLLPSMVVAIEMHEVGGPRNCDQTLDRCIHQVSN